MPKPNPKRSSNYSRYYRRAKTAQLTEHIKDRTPIYYGLAFGGIIVLIVVVVIVLTTNTSSGVTTQKGDTIDFRYIGTYDNGTIFDRNTLTSETIGNNQLLPYFDQNLVGRPVGTAFSFTIPPAQGYTSGTMAGLTLHFQVTILKVLRNDKQIYP